MSTSFVNLGAKRAGAKVLQTNTRVLAALWSHHTQWIKLVLLLAVLGLHFATRHQAAREIALPQKSNFYPWSYRPALSLLAGHGFTMFELSDTPEAMPVKEFQEMRRNRLTLDELKAYFSTVTSNREHFSFKECAKSYPVCRGEAEILSSPLPTTRILDVYAAAAIWKLFGIRWSALIDFYVLWSTGICYLIFLIGKKVGASFWVGLFAAALFMSSPFENEHSVRSIRDISPLWFGVIGFYSFICLLNSDSSLRRNLLASLVMGFGSTLGCGWRPDSLILSPFLLGALIVFQCQRKTTWIHVGCSAIFFVIGVGMVQGLLALLCPQAKQSPQVCFHMAYYGDYARCNWSEVENSLEISRDDIQTCFTAQFRHYSEAGLSAPMYYLSPEYGATCRKMYWEALQYNAFRWFTGFPLFYWRALEASQGRELGTNGFVVPVHVYPPIWVKGFMRSCLVSLHKTSLFFFVLGLPSLLLFCKERIRAGSLVVFSFYQAGAMFFVLPEEKHSGLLILPLVIIGAMGMWLLVRLFRARGLWKERNPFNRRNLTISLFVLASCGIVWIGLYLLTFQWSLAVRDGYIRAIRHLSGSSAPETILGPQRFLVEFPPENQAGAVGFLLEIHTGPHPGTLQCKHLHHDHPFIYGRSCVTKHRLHPNKSQYFFVTCLSGQCYGDPRRYQCSIILEGDAKIVSSTRVDMSNWRKLPLSTVFYWGERIPGSPFVGKRATETYYSVPPNLIDYFDKNP